MVTSEALKSNSNYIKPKNKIKNIHRTQSKRAPLIFPITVYNYFTEQTLFRRDDNKMKP